MFHILVFTVLLGLAQDILAQDCSASITLVERPGSWIEQGITQRIFDLHLTNNGACTFSGTVQATCTFPAGSRIGYSWGYNQNAHEMTGVPETSPGQTFAGIGFIASGWGDPSFTDISCTCDPAAATTGATATTGAAASTGAATTGAATTGAATTGAATTGAATTGAATAASSTTGTVVGTTTGGVIADSPYDVELNILVLSCAPGEGTLGVATLIMDSVGASYDVVSQSVLGTGAFTLTNADGSGMYYAIVSSVELTCWSATQLSQLQAYEIAFNVKTVTLYASPLPSNGVTLGMPSGVMAGTLTYAPAMVPFSTSLKTSALVEVYDVWVYPTLISNSTMATPAFYLQVDGNDTAFVAAAFVTYPDTRKHLEFYFGQGTWALFSAVIGPAWFNWVTNGIYAGARRIEFNVHTDDVFMATGMWDPVLHAEGTTTYRLTTADMLQIQAWQADLTSRMPDGSSFVVTFPFNGETIQEHGGYGQDSLYLLAHQIRDSFFWESHTWDHPDLDNLTYAQVYSEYSLNNATSLILFDNDLTNPNFNSLSVITPSISGLFNGAALKAIYDLGIRNLCGDNSHPEEAPAFVYHGWYTNVTSNGFDGMYIVPRHATNIYYDASLPEHVYLQYNYFYNTNLTFDDIMVMEVDTNTRNLMQFRHDPFMFHQANMRTITYEGKTTSLLAWWVEAITASVMSYTTLPMTSHTHDDLAEMLHAREARDACGFRARLRVDHDTNSVVGLHATSTGTCTFPISGVLTPTASSGITTETVGDEHTIWLDMTQSNPVDIVFTTPVSRE